MIDNPEIIDMAAFDKHKKTVKMIIYDYGYTGCNVDERCELLRKKIEAYVNCILRGGMIEHFSIKEKTVPKLKYEIQVFMPEYPPQEYLNYLTYASSEVSAVDPEHEIKITCVAP